mmetsp:Transcript_26408/g.35283  ORF Transcript_26408/g.35283 Transcript_26408/m.35283 type:complete len:192 (+) Transcript_26408:1261-1836(+)
MQGQIGRATQLVERLEFVTTSQFLEVDFIGGLATLFKADQAWVTALRVVLDTVVLEKDADHILLNVLYVNFWLDRVQVLWSARIDEDNTEDISLSVFQSPGFLQALDLPTGVVVAETVIAGEGLEDVSLLEGAVQLQDHVVLFEAVSIVLVDGFQEELKLRLHAPTDWVAKDELLRFAAQKARLNHEFLMY